MLKDSAAFSGFSAPDLAAAKAFYRDVLGVSVQEEGEMGLFLELNGTSVFIYPKADHTPAEFTVLNFKVTDIDAVIDDLASKGVQMERYDNLPAPQDEKGVLRGKAANMGPDIAWLKDPAGNILSVLAE